MAVRKERDRLQKHLESHDATTIVTSQLTDMSGKLNAVLEAIDKQGKYLQGMKSFAPPPTITTTNR